MFSRSLCFARSVVAPAAGCGSLALFWGAEKGTATTSSRVASQVLTSRFAVQGLYSRQQGRACWTATSRGLQHQQAGAMSLYRPFLQTRAAYSTSSAGGGGGGVASLMARYEHFLETSPVRTKMVTGLCLWSLGDAVAQIVPPLAGQAPPLESYDWMRTGRAALFGFALHAPTSHVHYNFLEWMTVRAGFKGWKIPVFKAFMEQFVYWSWVSNSMYHAAMGAMQGMNYDQIVQRIKDVLWETQKAQWVFWIPVQLLNFKYVPVRHQLNVVLLTSIVWTALLSAWYPPQVEDQSSSAVKAEKNENDPEHQSSKKAA